MTAAVPLVFVGEPAVAAPAGPVVAAGGFHACVLRSSLFSGGPACWGSNSFGQLGDGTTTTRLLPVAVDTSGVLNGVTLTQIAAGNDQTCALSTAGQAYCWGRNNTGQLGDTTTTNRSVPVAVDVSGVLNGVTLRKISLGSGHACALSSTGDVYCWGKNSYGEIGDGTTTDRPSPVLVSGGLTFTDLGAGTYDSCGVSSGRAYCWGYNGSGEIGDGTTTNRLVPTAVDTSGVLSGLTIVGVAHGQGHGCALSSAGRLYCWGTGLSGQLGDGPASNSSTPVAVSGSGVLNGVTVARVAAGAIHTCVVSTAGTPYCWGDDDAGELGDGANIQSNTPVAVVVSGALAGKTVVSASAAGYFTCVTTRLHGVYCWGSNFSGQLGDGTTTDRNTPVEVIPEDVAPGSPTNVHVVPGDGSATVSWTAPGALGNGTFTEYTVTAAPGGHTCTTTGTSCTVTGLSGGTRYTFTVVTSTTVADSDPSAAAAAIPTGLATTGQDIVLVVRVGLGMLAAGTVLLLLVRRRRVGAAAPRR